MNEKSELKNIALKIYDLGYYIVPVNQNKEPLCKWKRRLKREELEKLLDRAEAVALVCGEIHPFKNEGYVLVSIDIDNPEALSIEPIKNLLEKTFFIFTGPRCPYCRSKHLIIIEKGKNFKCDECGTEFSITAPQAEASRGRAIFIFVQNNVIKKYLKKTKFGDLEFLIHNYQVFLGKHKSGINYEPINLKLDRKDLGIIFVEEDHFLQLLNSIEEYTKLKKLKEREEQLEETNAEKIKEPNIQLRELSTEEIDMLASILKEIYKKGTRQYIWLYFAGWCAKACIHPLSCLKVLYKIYRDMHDEENIKTRASAIVYSYYKAGIAVNKKDFVSIIGVEPYGPTEKSYEFENLIKEGKLKGKSGLFEIFLSYFSREESLSKIRKIEEIIKVETPFSDIITRWIKRDLYVTALPRTEEILIERKKELNGNVKWEKYSIVAVGKIEDLKIVFNPITKSVKINLRWSHSKIGSIPFINASIGEIASRLKSYGLVLDRRNFEDILSALINGYVQKNLAEIRNEIDTAGFYLIEYGNEKRFIAQGFEIKTPDKNELKEALETLNELVEKWFGEKKEKIIPVIKWFLLAPFGYIVKTNFNTFLPYLYLYGPSSTGKSTLVLIGNSLYNFRYKYEKEGADYEIAGTEANTEFRLGKLISQGTFPICIKETRCIFEKPELVDMIKASIDNEFARARQFGGIYEKIPALACLCFTSNDFPPPDDALIRRFFIIRFSISDVLDQSKEEHRKRMEEFEKIVKPKLHKLKAIGNFTAWYISQNIEILKEASWIGHRWRDVSKRILIECYKFAEMEIPSWLDLSVEPLRQEDIYEHMKEIIINIIAEEIINRYTKVASIEKSTFDLNVPFYEKVRIVGEKNVIPWFIVKGDKIYIFKGLEEEIRKRRFPHTLDLKTISELFNWKYTKKSIDIKGKIVTRYHAETNFNDFILLFPTTFIENLNN